MINLKDYVLESMFDSEKTVSKSAITEIKNEVKQWASTHITKQRGRFKMTVKDGNVILEYANFFSVSINFADIPEYVKFKIDGSNGGFLYLYNVEDRFMEKFVDSEFGRLDIVSGTAKTVGEVQPCSIFELIANYQPKCNVYDFSGFKNCDIDRLLIDLPKRDVSINLDGLKMNYIDISAPGSFSDEKSFPVLTIDGKCMADEALLTRVKVKGLPKNIKVNREDLLI